MIPGGVYNGGFNILKKNNIYNIINTFIKKTTFMTIQRPATKIYYYAHSKYHPRFFYLKNAWVTNNYLGLQCICLFLFFFITESVLSVNKGIVAFVFFTLLFYNLNTQPKQTEAK